ncbi:MAG: DUF2029 domain-containing protein [Streptosporangiales bacterium]|nr:DUF2029 domain-containing protein [Streptosporangiales bacterium]
MPWLQWPLAFLLIAAAVAPIVIPWLSNPADQRLVDLDVYRTAGQSVLDGLPVYDVLTQPPQLLPFTYPPLAALFCVPLALMPWPVAQWVWVVFVYLCLTATTWYAFRAVLDRAGRFAPLALAALVAVLAYPMPVYDQIRFGQIDVFLILLCVADCVARSPRWPRGALIGLACAIKLTPGVFLIYLWITGRRKAAVTAVIFGAAVTLAAFVALPRDSVDFWFGALLDSERLGSNNGTANQSLRGMLMRTYLPDVLITVLWLAAVAIVAWYGFRLARRASLGGAELIGVAAVGLLATLLSPVGWIHHLAWLVVVLGALLAGGRSWRWWALAGGVWLFYTLHIPWYGVTMLADDIGPRALGKIVQDAFGLGAVALLPILAKRYKSVGNHEAVQRE